MTLDENDLQVLHRVYAASVVWNDYRQMMVCLYCQCGERSKVHDDGCVYRAFGDLLDRLDPQSTKHERPA